MTSDQMIEIVDGAGIRLKDAPIENANLYTWADPDCHNLYVGKASSKKRHDDEMRWKNVDHTREIVSGFVALLVENHAHRRTLRYDPATFDPAPLVQHVEAEGWNGSAIDGVLDRCVREDGAPTLEEVEAILVRLHIRTGRLIGNSQYASQWETPIGSFTDTVAVLAADAARSSGILPARTTVSTEGIDATDSDVTKH